MIEWSDVVTEYVEVIKERPLRLVNGLYASFYNTSSSYLSSAHLEF